MEDPRSRSTQHFGKPSGRVSCCARTAATHFSMIASREEREHVAELNLLAGKRARATTAYASALAYLAAGSALLEDDKWERTYQLAFALELFRAECEYLTGDLASSEQRLVQLSGRVENTPAEASLTFLLLAPVHKM